MFEIYKKGQGTTARWLAAATLLVFAVFGCYALQERLSGYEWEDLDLRVVQVSWSVLVSCALFLIASVLVGVLVNHKRFVDYLINSEAELRKVSWPTRAELKRQTIVVIVTIMCFGVLLLLADLLFGFLSRQLYGI